MSNATAKVSPIPAGMHSVTPHLVCAGAAEAIEFYKKAFGATELHRMPAPDGKLMHAQIQIGNAQVMLVDEMPNFGSFGPQADRASPVVIHLYVDDVDAVYGSAVTAGAKPVMPPQDMFWGDRYSQVQDPFNHRWSIATHIRDLSPEEMKEAACKMFSK